MSMVESFSLGIIWFVNSDHPQSLIDHGIFMLFIALAPAWIIPFKFQRLQLFRFPHQQSVFFILNSHDTILSHIAYQTPDPYHAWAGKIKKPGTGSLFMETA